MQIALNKKSDKCNGPVSVFRRTVKRTGSRIHLGFIGDFEDQREAKGEVNLWSSLKRKHKQAKLFKVIFRAGMKS